MSTSMPDAILSRSFHEINTYVVANSLSTGTQIPWLIIMVMASLFNKKGHP